MLSSTRVKLYTSASRSQPSGNTKKDKIQQTPRSTQKNKVEAYLRKVKSSFKNKDCVVAPKGIANLQHPKLNVNYELKYVKCNGCMLSDNHDLCVLDFSNDMNASNKSKSVKKSRTFTIVANACPLTRITTATDVPLMKPTTLESDIPKPMVTLVYSRKPRKSKTNVPVSNSNNLKHVFANKKKPTRYSHVRGLLKLKFEKDHLCSACTMGKSMKKTHKPIFEDTNQEKLYLLHMDLCGPMRVVSVNGKKTKDEAPDFIIKFLKMIRVRLNVHVRRIRTDNGTKFVNQTLREYYEKVGISHETSVARSPHQNGIVKRRNCTLIEAARTMLIYAKALLFLWADVLTAMPSKHSSSGPVLHEMTPVIISSGLMSNPPPSTLLTWTTPTLQWKSISGLRKKKLIDMGKCLTRKLLRMVRSGIMKTFTTSDLLKLNSQLYPLMTRPGEEGKSKNNGGESSFETSEVLES
ncbi:retrovirus-related pol polyprotein from transposon TNT 1-94 [Tanacetum coccineum]